jgi:hypothetical protein
MRYLCLIYHDESARDAISAAEWEAMLRAGIARQEEMLASGASLDGSALQPVRTAMTVRCANGRTSVTNGPFAETKEQLAGYVLIEAPDMEAAVREAATLPPGRFGAVEVRPLWETDDVLVRRLP